MQLLSVFSAASTREHCNCSLCSIVQSKNNIFVSSSNPYYNNQNERSDFKKNLEMDMYIPVFLKNVVSCMHFYRHFGNCQYLIMLFTCNFEHTCKNACRIPHFSKLLIQIHVKFWILPNIPKILVKKRVFFIEKSNIQTKLLVQIHKLNEKMLTYKYPI